MPAWLYVVGPVIAVTGLIALYRAGYRAGKNSAQIKAQKISKEMREKYEKGFNDGFNMSDEQRAEWVRNSSDKK